MALLDVFALEPFSVNEPLIDALLLEPDMQEVFLAIRTDGNAGTGTISDPFNVNPAFGFSFDTVMNSFTTYTTVHLGPGIHPSSGHADGVSGGWQPKRGQRIVGAGVDATTIQLVVASPTADKSYFAVGADDPAVLNEFEISDLTIDCNQGGLAGVAAGAIKVYGTHVLIKRVHVFNFGTRTTSQKGVGIATAGAFPDNPEPFDCVIEECVIEQPYANNLRETACIEFAGGERQVDGVMAYHKGCVVRNCIINCLYSDAEASISNISISGSVATVTTKVPLGRSNGAWVIVTGALVNGASANPYNGAYTISNVSANGFTYTPVTPSPTVNPTGDMYIGRPPSQRLAIKSITYSGGVATLETFLPHNRVPGQNVVVNNVGGVTPSMNQSVTINDLGPSPSPTILRFNYTGTGTADVTNAWIGVDFYGIVTSGSRGVVVEGNRILETTFGVYRDLWGSKDVTIRDNYFQGVLSAIYEKMGQVSGGNSSQQPARVGASLTQNGALAVFSTAQPHGFSVGMIVSVSGATQGAYNGTFQIATVPSPTSFTYAMSTDPGGNATGSPVANGQAAVSLVRNKTLATFTTSAAHGLSFGDAVAIANASPSVYNGIFPVASVPTPTSFTYIMSSDPASNASGSFTFGALWQVGRLLIENNIIELVLTITSGIDLPTGIRLDRKASTPAAPPSPYVFSQAFLRSNVIRHVNNASDSSALPMAIQINSCEAAIVEENVVKLDRADSIRFTACSSVKFFNNQTPSGGLVQGYDTVKTEYVNELTTDVELGALLAT